MIRVLDVPLVGTGAEFSRQHPGKWLIYRPAPPYPTLLAVADNEKEAEVWRSEQMGELLCVRPPEPQAHVL
ncbi:hypothetical protein HY624_04305 [Candidatus Uhrbacteria bacterium]|nr:hypothetical protein [Candidatus Uhrbacteria bacterium]